jgi:hypothetical protein
MGFRSILESIAGRQAFPVGACQYSGYKFDPPSMGIYFTVTTFF